MLRLKGFVAALLMLVLGTAAARAESAAVTAPPAPIKRGVNVLGYDPIWKDPANGRFQEKHFGAIRAAGFDFIRVNLHGFGHMDAENRLSPQWFDRVDWIVDEATKAGLKVILDEHDFNTCAEDVAACRTKLTAFWRQVATRYRDRPANLLFEPLNEPYGPLDAP